MMIIKTKESGVTMQEMVFILFFLIQTSIVSAQQPDLQFSTLNVLEALSDSKVSAITQDSIGYLWIGTEEGLFRFDGQSVFPYLKDENDRYSLPSNRINKLFMDSENNLWICTNGGLCKYNPEFDNFLQIVVESDTKGVSGFYLTSITEDRTGQLYVSDEKTIYKYDRSNNLFSKVTGIVEGKISSFIFDDQNNIWIAASSG